MQPRPDPRRWLIPSAPLQYSDHQVRRGPEFFDRACELSLEGIVSERADAPDAAGSRGLWLKVKCLNREEFVVVGWTDPEGSRPWLGSLLLAYYGRLVYAGRAGSASMTRSLGDCGAVCNRSPCPICRWTCHHPVQAALALHLCSAACIG
jgi:hypothetical protein